MLLTSVGDPASVPELAEEDPALGMHGIHDRLPCLHMLLRPYARRVGVPIHPKQIKITAMEHVFRR